MDIKVFDSVWSPAYALTLKAIPIERIDIAESRLFDVEQAVERIEQGSRNPKVTHAAVASGSSAGQAVTWAGISSDSFAVEGTEVRSLVTRTFLVIVHVVHVVSGYGTSFTLWKNGGVALQCFMGHGNGFQTTTSASCVLQLDEGEKLSLVGKGVGISVGSTITITELGS